MAPGLEPVAAAELTALGITVRGVEPGGVEFDATVDEIMRANLWLRSASRVLHVVASGTVTTWKGLRRLADRAPWDAYLGRRRPVRFRVSCSRSKLYHEGAVSERLARAVDRPAGKDDRAQTIWVRNHENAMTLSVDASGELLHRRGYRQAVSKAPLRETLAAGILLAVGWDPATSLLDPMCGSGTFLVEAAWIAQGRAPGLTRAFAFERWPCFAPRVWSTMLDEARDRCASAPLPEIVGVDIDPRAVTAAAANLERAGLDIRVEDASIEYIDGTDGDPGTIVANPPYGKRIAGADKAFGQIRSLLDRLSGWRAAVLYAAPGKVPRGWKDTIRISNGGVPVRVITRPAFTFTKRW